MARHDSSTPHTRTQRSHTHTHTERERERAHTHTHTEREREREKCRPSLSDRGEEDPDCGSKMADEDRKKDSCVRAKTFER